MPEGVAKPVEIDRVITSHGAVTIAGRPHLIGAPWAGLQVALRLDGHLLHAIIDGSFVGSWPCPVASDYLAGLRGARTPDGPLPRPALPRQSLRAHRRVHANGPIMVAGQSTKLGPRHRGKLVTVSVAMEKSPVMAGYRSPLVAK